MDSQQVSSLKTILRKRKLAIKMHDPSQIIIMHRKPRASSCSKRLSIWKDLVFRSTVVPSSFQLINLINKRKGTEIHLRRVLLLTQRTEYYKYSILHTQHYRTHPHIGWSFLVFFADFIIAQRRERNDIIYWVHKFLSPCYQQTWAINEMMSFAVDASSTKSVIASRT